MTTVAVKNIRELWISRAVLKNYKNFNQSLTKYGNSNYYIIISDYL